MKSRLQSLQQLHEVYLQWLRLPITAPNRHADLRFGQYVWINHEWERESWPELFYLENVYDAYRMLEVYIHAQD